MQSALSASPTYWAEISMSKNVHILKYYTFDGHFSKMHKFKFVSTIPKYIKKYNEPR